MVLKSFLHGSLSVFKKKPKKTPGWLLLYHKQNWHAYLVLHQNTPCHEKYLDIVHDCSSLRDINMVYKYEIEKGALRGKKNRQLKYKEQKCEQPYNEPSSQSRHCFIICKAFKYLNYSTNITFFHCITSILSTFYHSCLLGMCGEPLSEH